MGWTYDDPAHGYPHGSSSSKVFGEAKSKDTAREATEIVDTDNDTGQAVAGMPKDVQEVRVANDTTEDALIIAKENKCHSTSYSNGQA